MAAPRAYTGAWRSQSSYVDRALAPNPGVDPSHSRRDVPDPNRPPAGKPRADHPPLYLTEDPQATYAYEVDTPGLVLDFEPRTHDAGDPEVSHPAPIPGAEAGLPSTTAHQLDRGAVVRNTYTAPIGRGSDEEWLTTRHEQGAIQGDLTTAVLRGDNALALNNPDGYRLGWTIWRRMHRTLPHERFTHQERRLHPVTAATTVDSPAMTAEESNRYTSPFPWNRLQKLTTPQTPMLRRDPGAWDEAAVTDGSEEPSSDLADWVVG